MHSLLDQTAPQVSAFARNMQFGRLDAGLVNLAFINQLIDARQVEARADGRDA